MAQELYCWRCKIEIPMLDEDEWARMVACMGDGVGSENLQAAVDCYNQITGMDETNHNAVFHHRISLYGPRCDTCGRPRRTPRASFCADCVC